MEMHFDTSLATCYKSGSQKTRVLSETWVTNHVFCPCCGNAHIKELKNNMPVADMKCDNCKEIFELKSQKGKIGKIIPDGAYHTMMQRISSITNPDLFILQYTPDYLVTDLTLIPKFFFVPGIIKKRKPLGPNARRAGWVGCNIMYDKIPEQGKIPIIRNSVFVDKELVIDQYAKLKRIETNNIETRGWLFDVLNCVNSIQKDVFSLKEMYTFADVLQDLHKDNHNIEAKIRQQLQYLRDKGFIEFLDRGTYRKIL
ncbi:DpnI domain-containing protein [Ruminococcus sp.]|uniref:DpnI domain-containing protein n=1 Tax=Ruminococcus sp. TaxID=41978 RepID=UPI00388D4515